MQAAADKYSVQDAFQGSSVLITGATGCSCCRICLGPCDLRQLTSCRTAGYVGSLVLEQLLRVGHISKVSPALILYLTKGAKVTADQTIPALHLFCHLVWYLSVIRQSCCRRTYL